MHATESRSERLAERYGTSRSAGRTLAARIGIGILALVFLATVIWVGLVVSSSSPVKVTTTGYTHVSDTQMRVSFELNTKPGTAVRCSVEALNGNRGQVGFTSVEVPQQSERVSHHSVVVTTQQPAVSGVVKSCTPL
ncbi:DUF4307 domain-containing protein [Helcobacillus massiliensis]|uniref:DUF4307 domain-containing protein n=1 Tax=Helcobacillus massiliensis TaxID=521392 RepID=A0A839R294_9MICO|nr:MULTISPECIES: DUF4307 domain-containing protein [Helcobacillus]MBB3022876.1 hypothetical protein [Helcobacillus massiliensis]MCG7426275.1 DUF4307 domain-containing protein [Helcobacillus sp. ACRRO]MCT1558141.1 DUF4307 domain-containing protein [Helcobacillus massiliensis]MCT2036504.1 DUF4307 domain-containing protein [Helcobacillus massiliensis]MCT2332308.1 DUF4307 domain-containing protein [Helcobacillus massiliensis]